MTDQASVADKAAEHWMRMHRLEKVFLTIVVLLSLVVAAVSTFAIVRQEEIKNSQVRQECVVRITAEFQGAVAEAFAAPPAPNQARDESVAKIEQAAHKLSNLDDHC